MKIEHRVTGEILFEAELDSLKLTVEAAVKKKACLRGADLRGACLSGADLEGSDLRGAYLSGSDLEGSDLRGTDLRGACLRGAYLEGSDLRGAYLEGSDLRGADLRGACLRGADLLDAGQDSRGYRFVAVKQKKGPYLIFAGCHTFTLKEAQAHWKKRHEGDQALQAECQAKIKLIAAVAKARGWESKGEAVKPGQEPDKAEGAEAAQ